MMTLLEESCGMYGFDVCNTELIRHNENMTYMVRSDKKHVMRIHKPVEGMNLSLLRADEIPEMMIRDEMRLIEYLGGCPMGVQRVKKNIRGENVSLLSDGTPVTVLEWVDGETVEKTGHTPETAYMLGQTVGRLHKALDGTKTSDYPHRYRYDGAMAQRLLDECNTAYESGHMSKRQAGIISDTLTLVRDYLYSAGDSLTLCHADMGKSNLIVTGSAIVPIDFSLSGFCVEEMDIAMVICEISDPVLMREILRGYKKERGRMPDSKALDVCLCLGILLFICCQHNKCHTQEWFGPKLDDWCGHQFTALLEGRSVSNTGGVFG